VQQAIRALERDPRVDYVEPNYVLRTMTSDPNFDQLWGLQKIDAPEAWGVTTGSAGVVVGVIDSGVDFGHPDLATAMWVNPGESCDACPTNGVDDDGNGYVDDWRGWDFANGDNDPSDDNGHGTHVAGTIGAAGDNGVGITGVSQRVGLMGLKFTGANGEGTAADAVSAILYATANGADITNNSYGGDGFSEAMLAAIRTADALDSLFVAAAGIAPPTTTPTRSTPPATTSRTWCPWPRRISMTRPRGSPTTGPRASISPHPA
jgi:subtilisin family serine protease